MVKKIESILAAIIAVSLTAGAQRAGRAHRYPARRRPGPEEVSLPHRGDDITAPGGTRFEGLRRLTDMPGWLCALARPEYLKTAIERSVPEFASGAMVLKDARPLRRRLKDGVFDGLLDLTVEGPGGARRVVRLRGVADPGRPARVDSISSGVPFGEEGWRCAVPELRLVLETLAADTALPALAMLTDPSRARGFLEGAIRACSPA